MSRSSGKVWFRLLSVAVTLKTDAVNPETLIVAGYGEAGPSRIASMKIESELKNVWAGRTKVVLCAAALFAGLESSSVAEITAKLVTVPGESVLAVMLTIALPPTSRLPSPQVTVPRPFVHPP